MSEFSASNEHAAVKKVVKARKPKGMSREVYALLGQQGLPSIMPSSTPGFKKKRGSSKAAKWNWASFENQARDDDLKLCHWVRATSQLVEYPFAKLNKKIFTLKYTDDEYEKLLAADPKVPIKLMQRYFFSLNNWCAVEQAAD